MRPPPRSRALVAFRLKAGAVRPGRGGLAGAPRDPNPTLPLDLEGTNWVPRNGGRK